MNVFEYQARVEPAWVDHNNHMNDAAYVRVFSDATDAWLASLGLDTTRITDTGYTVFTLENRTQYLKELQLDAHMTVHVMVCDYDEKRIHAVLTLSDANDVACARYEVMLMGMDQTLGKPAPFPKDIFERLVATVEQQTTMSLPESLQTQIGIRRKNR